MLAAWSDPIPGLKKTCLLVKSSSGSINKPEYLGARRPLASSHDQGKLVNEYREETVSHFTQLYNVSRIEAAHGYTTD